jgi:recombination protein RecA
MWGPRGQKLTAELAGSAPGRNSCSLKTYLPDAHTEPVLSDLRNQGVDAYQAAQLIGAGAGDPQPGLHRVLGQIKLRRDRLGRLSESLDSKYLRDVLGEDLYYDRVASISPPEWRPTFDIAVEELHTFVAEGVVVHNCAPPFKEAEFDIMYGEGISRYGELIDLGVEHKVIDKSGAWFSYKGERLGQGRENSKNALRDNPELAARVEADLRAALGINGKTQPAAASTGGGGKRGSAES